MGEEIYRDKVADWLKKNWKGAKQCPICHSNDWNIGSKPVEIREFSGGGLVVGGPVYPLVNVTCNVCGYTLLFNAIVSGLIEREEKKPVSSAETDQSAEDEERRRRR